MVLRVARASPAPTPVSHSHDAFVVRSQGPARAAARGPARDAARGAPQVAAGAPHDGAARCPCRLPESRRDRQPRRPARRRDAGGHPRVSRHLGPRALPGGVTRRVLAGRRGGPGGKGGGRRGAVVQRPEGRLLGGFGGRGGGGEAGGPPRWGRSVGCLRLGTAGRLSLTGRRPRPLSALAAPGTPADGPGPLRRTWTDLERLETLRAVGRLKPSVALNQSDLARAAALACERRR